jgi:hypothetical protein
MIIPTPEFDPLFAVDGKPFQEKMWGYIRREFADLLGPQLTSLDASEALNAISSNPRHGRNQGPSRADAA